MKPLRWIPFILMAFFVNALIFFVVPFASAVLVEPAKKDYKATQSSTQVDVSTRTRSPEKQHKEIRQIPQQAKAFKPSRAIAGPARTIQMDLSLASGGGAGGNGVGIAMGGGGSGMGRPMNRRSLPRTRIQRKRSNPSNNRPPLVRNLWGWSVTRRPLRPGVEWLSSDFSRTRGRKERGGADGTTAHQ